MICAKQTDNNNSSLTLNFVSDATPALTMSHIFDLSARTKLGFERADPKSEC